MGKSIKFYIAILVFIFALILLAGYDNPKKN